jgi:transcriptional regulator with XRE-family HTH domain
MEKKYFTQEQQGKRLKESRSYLRLTQSVFGAKLGLNKTQVKDRESGLVKISLSEAKNIELEYGINASWIITGEGSMVPEATDAPLINDNHGAYGAHTSPPDDSDSLLKKTAHVLNTNSFYRSALKSNVLAFFDAVAARESLAAAEAQLAQCRRENIELKQRLNEKERLIEQQAATISELRAGKSGVNGV